MAKKLTKGVLNGADHQEVMKLNWNDETYEVDIKPLNNKEASKVEALMQEGLNVSVKSGIKGNMNRDISIDTKANHKGRKKADYLTVAYGTIDEDITEDVVENEFPPHFTTEIANRIRTISGMSNQKDLDKLMDEKENPSDSKGE